MREEKKTNIQEGRRNKKRNEKERKQSKIRKRKNKSDIIAQMQKKIGGFIEK